MDGALADHRGMIEAGASPVDQPHFIGLTFLFAAVGQSSPQLRTESIDGGGGRLRLGVVFRNGAADDLPARVDH